MAGEKNLLISTRCIRTHLFKKKPHAVHPCNVVKLENAAQWSILERKIGKGIHTQSFLSPQASFNCLEDRTCFEAVHESHIRQLGALRDPLLPIPTPFADRRGRESWGLEPCWQTESGERETH